MIKIKINQTLCNKCGICVLTCPFNLFTQNNKDSYPIVSNTNLCVSCGQCVAICPEEAIEHSDISKANIIKNKPFETILSALKGANYGCYGKFG